MPQQISISFEGGIIRVVYASSHRGKMIIRKTLLLSKEEFDVFLRSEKARSFSVVSDFRVFYQDILFLPSANKKFLRPLIETEMKKKFPELKEFSFFYMIKGETQVEGKKKLEVFVFAVGNDDLSKMTERFERHGKTVKSLYPSALALANIVNATCGPTDGPVLCIAGSGTLKTFFLMEKGKLNFVRTVQSSGSGMNDLDVQNVNMTLNYCRQTLRTNPLQVILLGSSGSVCETTADLMTPVMCIRHIANVVSDDENIQDFIAPISAFMPIADVEDGNMLPRGYRELNIQKKALSWLTALFAVFSISGLVYLKNGLSETALLKEKIMSLQSEISAMEPERRTYEARLAEMLEVAPYAGFINSSNSSPDMQKAFTELQSLATENVNVQSINVTAEGASLHVQIKGGIVSRNYTELQRTYQRLLGSVKKTKGIEVLSEKIDLTDKSFVIEANYRS